ncbi:cellulase family glycosylhydrolase [Butyrivibrio sp. AE2032]|uniref:cellulase family glycosylhydrolase n=1 Tax=Butyrivibrio sp. AE2032 TaxID=1458463 RepID=UPI0009E05C6F|nr:cellulase family glycosylhydrolase [Butyrivibrio sp. AE2032]
MKRAIRLISSILLLSLTVALLVRPITVSADAGSYLHAKPYYNGSLSVKGTKLIDEKGRDVVLRGVSFHGLSWFPEFVSKTHFKQLSQEWNCNLVRLPLYTDMYIRAKDDSVALVKQGIDYAIENDMYVIVDWHVLEDANPNLRLDFALEFFQEISTSYPSCPNLIFEICNEPNGETTWTDIYNYAQKVIPVIREHNPQAVIIVGTPVYDRTLMAAARKPLPYDNVMYALHFYAGSHKEDLQAELLEGLERGLPVFISECGLTEASGDGPIDYEAAGVWFNILRDRGISYTIWSFSNKDETSAMFYPDYDPQYSFTDANLTPAGYWAKQLIIGEKPDEIAIIPSKNEHNFIPSWITSTLTLRDHLTLERWPKIALYVLLAQIAIVILLLLFRAYSIRKHPTYDTITGTIKNNYAPKERLYNALRILVLLISIFFTIIYLYWRAAFSVPVESGPLAVGANLILLFVEMFGFVESLSLYMHLMGMRKHPLPQIADEEYPDVDIFIATYNEPNDLLERTINACKHLEYPDKSKVHIWVCDDNRRPTMRALAEQMEVGYFDRPDNSGAKAGNLNHAMGLTNAPYIVTLDADMMVKSDFLLKTIPYFVDVEKRNADKPEGERTYLGLLQTPQCFYEPDIFQYALYSEKTAPNEQDFFYRTIEVAKTASNSVIYGGSNTVLSRRALNDIGGFFTESITEDFATGLLIESNGYVSLALPEPLASGKTPDTLAEHIKQRIRWGRGVISTAKQLHIFTRKGLSFAQRISYWSSVVYWYSPIKNMIYILSPLVFAVFAILVFKCSWVDLLLFWFPMYILQDLSLRAFSNNAVSLKWSGIYETSVMPYLLVPIIKEMLGITTKKFAVTDKSKKTIKRKIDLKVIRPFLILIALCLFGIIRSILTFKGIQSLGLVILLFWLVRNLYFLIMSIFLASGRDGDSEAVHVVDAEMATIHNKKDGAEFFGVTTYLTEHNLKIFLDEAPDLAIGDYVNLEIDGYSAKASVDGVVTGINPSRSGPSAVYSIEILDFKEDWHEYLQVLYDRIPSLPQSLQRDYGIISHLIKNIAHRVLQ